MVASADTETTATMARLAIGGRAVLMALLLPDPCDPCHTRTLWIPASAGMTKSLPLHVFGRGAPI